MTRHTSLLARIDTVLTYFWTAVMVAALCVMMAGALTQVIMRTGWSAAWPPFTDIIAYAFTIATFSGAAILFRGRHHLAIDFFVNLLPPRAQRVVAILSDAIVLLTCLWLAYLSIGMIQSGTRQFSPTLGFSLSWIYLVVPASLLSCAFFLALHGFRRDPGVDHGEAQILPGPTGSTTAER